MEKLKELVNAGADVVLVSQGLEQVMRPLARHLGVRWVVANRLEFRDGIATGRLLDPVIRPRGVFARIAKRSRTVGGRSRWRGSSIFRWSSCGSGGAAASLARPIATDAGAGASDRAF